MFHRGKYFVLRLMFVVCADVIKDDDANKSLKRDPEVTKNIHGWRIERGSKSSVVCVFEIAETNKRQTRIQWLYIVSDCNIRTFVP